MQSSSLYPLMPAPQPPSEAINQPGKIQGWDKSCEPPRAAKPSMLNAVTWYDQRLTPFSSTDIAAKSSKPVFWFVPAQLPSVMPATTIEPSLVVAAPCQESSNSVPPCPPDTMGNGDKVCNVRYDATRTRSDFSRPGHNARPRC